MELDYKAIGKRVKIARIKADMAQDDLANQVGISAAHMSNIETGKTRVIMVPLPSHNSHNGGSSERTSEGLDSRSAAPAAV